jgi:hypothetical protein
MRFEMRDLRVQPIYFRLAEDELLLWSSACTQIRMIRRLQQRLASDPWETLRARDEALMTAGIRELMPLCRLLGDGRN